MDSRHHHGPPRAQPHNRDRENPAPDIETEPAPETADNSWRPIGAAPRDHIIEGRFAPDQEVGRPIRWRNSRHRVGHRWVDGGVWHAAETAGAVELQPTEWREWVQVPIRFAAENEPEAA
jgi:hypothetical protein